MIWGSCSRWVIVITFKMDIKRILDLLLYTRCGCAMYI